MESQFSQFWQYMYILLLPNTFEVDALNVLYMYMHFASMGKTVQVINAILDIV